MVLNMPSVMSLTDFIRCWSRGRPRCGTLGWLQLSAWEALDKGLDFDAWVAAVPEELAMAPATYRIQFRKAEVDRNACLVDDDQADKQTRYGKIIA